MAKAIKFNLICDGKPIRTIEDLQQNFVIEDVLAYYNNKLLHRWLKVRGYTAELEQVEAIKSQKAWGIIKELIVIFDVAAEKDKIKETVYILEYLEERKSLIEKYNKCNFKAQSVINDYAEGYNRLVNGIIENPDNAALIKANLTEITENYKWILELDHRNLFYTLKDKSPLAIMCLLMNSDSRKYYLPISKVKEDGTNTSDIDGNKDKSDMFSSICNMIVRADFATSLGDKLHEFSGVTDGYWKDLEPKGKKYMIISMGEGDYVRAAGIQGGDLSRADITNKFVIVDGIDYKSNSNSRKLLYMEV